jgi:hypothetical protein
MSQIEPEIYGERENDNVLPVQDYSTSQGRDGAGRGGKISLSSNSRILFNKGNPKEV